MKTAKEMFKELGFMRVAHKDFILYTQKNDLGAMQIYFWGYKQSYNIYAESRFKQSTWGIDRFLHQAITQQMKELGWLEEEENE